MDFRNTAPAERTAAELIDSVWCHAYCFDRDGCVDGVGGGGSGLNLADL